MMIASEKMSEIHRRLLERKDRAATIGTVYKFVFEGDGGGTFVVDMKEDIGVRAGDGPAACTLRFSVADGLDLLEGRNNGMTMFMTGKLKVDGDVSLAMKLPALMGILR